MRLLFALAAAVAVFVSFAALSPLVVTFFIPLTVLCTFGSCWKNSESWLEHGIIVASVAGYTLAAFLLVLFISGGFARIIFAATAASLLLLFLLIRFPLASLFFYAVSLCFLGAGLLGFVHILGMNSAAATLAFMGGATATMALAMVRGSELPRLPDLGLAIALLTETFVVLLTLPLAIQVSGALLALAASVLLLVSGALRESLGDPRILRRHVISSALLATLLLATARW
ncbi:MAG: hypothetical protein AAB562_00645 [Patescibacteria group bacterium]